MEIKKSEKFVGAFTLIYLLVFSFYFARKANYEFLGYVGVVVLVFVWIALTLRKVNFTPLILWGLSIWGFVHMLGGSLMTKDGVLYAWRIFPFVVGEGGMYILKFDQVVHFYGFGITALVAYHLLSLNWKSQGSEKLIYLFAVLISAGFGVLNEIVEFISFLTWPDTWVGDFYNVGLDLIFNTIGAVTAMVFVYFRKRLFSREFKN